jgi:hypothetical protein
LISQEFPRTLSASASTCSPIHRIQRIHRTHFIYCIIPIQIRPAFGSSGVGHGGSVAPAAHAIKMSRQAFVRHQASLGGPGAYDVPQVQWYHPARLASYIATLMVIGRMCQSNPCLRERSRPKKCSH